jgi:hypothetical protein
MSAQRLRGSALLLAFRTAAKNQKTTAILQGRTFLSRRSQTSAPTLSGTSIVCLYLLGLIPCAGVANATAHARKTPSARTTALGGFVKDIALARVLGETLFRDTAEVMSDSANLSATAAPGPTAAGQYHDNSAVGQVARTVLAHRSLDKYLWLIRRAYDDSMWKGGDRTLIEQHFPLIWRTSILLYESTLGASPHRVRVCIPTADSEEFDCHDELTRPRMIPIPAQPPFLLLPHQSNIG